jgi:dihydrofolate reductase
VKAGATIIRNNIEAEVKRIQNEPGKDIWLFGGSSLFTSLFNLGLVDEIWLSVHPIILGSGKLLFNNIDKRTVLTLTDTKTYSSGLVSLTYACK